MLQARFVAMGCPCEIRLDADDALQPAMNAALAEIHRLETKYSRWLADSPWLRLCRQARTPAGARLDAESAHLLRYALDAWRFTDGHFHPGLLPLWRYWHQTRKPDAEQVRQRLARAHLSGLRLENGRMWLKRWLELDLDGLVKEYAVDRAIECLRARLPQPRLLVVNLGGDVRVAGSGGERVGITSMGGPPRTVWLQQQALASSGTRERGRRIQGRWYSHLIHPKTGWPLRCRDLQISVVSPTCLLAGTLSTAALLMGNKGPGWLRQTGLPFLWQQGRRQIAHLWNDGA